MRGLDPRIHHLRKIYAKRMDPRVKPAGDGSGWASADSNRPGAAVVGITIAEALKPSSEIDMDRVRQITRRVVSKPLVDKRPPKEILDQAWRSNA